MATAIKTRDMLKVSTHDSVYGRFTGDRKIVSHKDGLFSGNKNKMINEFIYKVVV